MARLTWLFIISIIILTGCNLATAPPLPTATPVPPQLDLTCDELVVEALQAVGPVCNATGRNQACYGNNQVNAQFQQGFQEVFASAGDLAALENIRVISTSPMNIDQQTWGVAFVKAQANLPDALPGQNVTFLLYGGASLDNVSPAMQAVVLSTGIGGATCTSLPPSAVLLQSPGGTQVTMNINGASVSLASTIHLTATQNNLLIISTISGTAVIEAFGTSRTVVPGAQVTLPLGSTDGLAVVGPPSEPQPFDLNSIMRAPFNLLPDPVQVPSPITPGPTGTPTLPGLPITPTLPPVTIPLPPTAIPPVCIPRADWVFTYVIQPGDTLFGIAQRFGLTLTQLQTGNCIANANQIFVGQVLRVPSAPLPPPTRPTSTPTRGSIGPTLQPTSTTVPIFPSSTPTDPNFRADQTTLTEGQCTMIRWAVQNVEAVFFQGDNNALSNAFQVCPQTTTRYTLLVIHPDGTQVPYFLTITVEPLPTEPPVID